MAPSHTSGWHTTGFLTVPVAAHIVILYLILLKAKGGGETWER
jgi:hypothetical protein